MSNEGSAKFDLTFSEWVIALRRASSERRKLAQITAASASSSWASPQHRDWRSGLVGDETFAKNSRPLSEQAVRWPTPTASEGQMRTYKPRPSEDDGRGHGRSLQAEALNRRWPTPNTRDSVAAARHTTSTGVMHPGTTLTDAMRSWSLSKLYPTPKATQYGSSQNGINGKGGAFERPSAGTPSLDTMARHGLLPSRQRPTTSSDGDGSSQSSLVLNPLFVEMLMGWPLNHTAVACRHSASAIESIASASAATGSFHTKPALPSSPSPRSSTDVAHAHSRGRAMTEVLHGEVVDRLPARRMNPFTLKSYREERAREEFAIELGSYRVILADPSWSFSDAGSRMHPGYAGKGRKEARYRVMRNEDIVDLGEFVWSIGAEDSFLFLWAPNAIVLDGLATRTIEAWGYKPKQLIPWFKTTKTGEPRLGGGHYTRVCTEQLILATRGRCAPLVKDLGIPGEIHAPRGTHSAKPDESYRLIQRLAPGPYIELFGRRRFNESWNVVGNQFVPLPRQM
jgi:N6-adenosine-specific RNA methylase IME4